MVELMLSAVRLVAHEFGLDPNVVLDWRESVLSMWTTVVTQDRRREALVDAVVLSHAVWAPKELPRLLEERRPAMSKQDAQAAIERAKEIGRMQLAPEERLRRRRRENKAKRKKR